MSEWISVEERLPELTDRDWFGCPERRVFFVAVAQPDVVQEGRACLNMNKIVFWPIGPWNGFLAEEVSHWMPRPLPEPPKAALPTETEEENA